MECHPVIDSGGTEMTGRKATIRTDLYTASQLRAMASGNASPRKVKRLLALANALDGMSFTSASAAVAAGMERQALSDAVKRYNAEGVGGLDATAGGRFFFAIRQAMPQHRRAAFWSPAPAQW
jgi:hypothetical protein